MNKLLCLSLITPLVLANVDIGALNNSSVINGKTKISSEEFIRSHIESDNKLMSELKKEVTSTIENNISHSNNMLEQIKKDVEESIARIEEERRLARLREEEELRLAKIRLREEITFNEYDVTVPSNMTIERIRGILPYGLQGLEEVFYNTEMNYGINVFFLIGVVRQESGNGLSDFAINRNNMGGIRNSDGSFRYFSSKAECIDYMGRLLKNQYLTPYQVDEDGSVLGAYYNGTSISSINIFYCEGNDWTEKVTNIAYESYYKAKEIE